MAVADEIQAVRFEIGDTDDASRFVADSQIEYALTEESSVRGAAAACLESQSRRLAQLADVSTGDLRVSYSGRANALAAQAKELRSRVTAAAPPFAGGISRADKEARAEDSDRVQGGFERNQFDHPCT